MSFTNCNCQTPNPEERVHFLSKGETSPATLSCFVSLQFVKYFGIILEENLHAI